MPGPGCLGAAWALAVRVSVSSCWEGPSFSSAFSSAATTTSSSWCSGSGVLAMECAAWFPPGPPGASGVALPSE